MCCVYGYGYKGIRVSVLSSTLIDIIIFITECITLSLLQCYTTITKLCVYNNIVYVQNNESMIVCTCVCSM